MHRRGQIGGQLGPVRQEASKVEVLHLDGTHHTQRQGDREMREKKQKTERGRSRQGKYLVVACAQIRGRQTRVGRGRKRKAQSG
jgi:hypothetical protein